MRDAEFGVFPGPFRMMRGRGREPSTILAIDTSGTFCSVALARGDELLVRRLRVGNAHTQHVLPMLRALLADAALALTACDAIAFGAGPGAFTGLRVACALSQGLAFGAGVRVIPIGTLTAMAHAVVKAEGGMPRPAGHILVAHDARMGEVYWSLVRWDGDAFDEEVGPFVTSPRALQGWLRAHAPTSSRRCVGVGNAWSAHPAAMDGLVDEVVYRECADAADVARLGQRAWAAGNAIDPASAAPVYVRDEVALTTVQRQARDAAALVPLPADAIVQ